MNQKDDLEEEQSETELLSTIKEGIENLPEFENIKLLITHLKNLVVVTRKGEKIEADLIGINNKGLATMAFHAKVILGYPEDIKLLGKLNLSKKGIEKTWVVLDKKIPSDRFIEGIHKDVGIITFKRKGNRLSEFKIDTPASRVDAPYLRKTQQIIKQMMVTQEIDIRRYWLIGTSKHNWEICKKRKLFGMPTHLGRGKKFDYITKKFEKTPIGSIVIIYVTGVGIVGCWVKTSDMFESNEDLGWKDNKGRPWLCEKRFWMFPMVTEEFPKPIKWKEIRTEMSKFKTGHPQGRTELTKNDYEKILSELLRRNKDELKIKM